MPPSPCTTPHPQPRNSFQHTFPSSSTTLVTHKRVTREETAKACTARWNSEYLLVGCRDHPHRSFYGGCFFFVCLPPTTDLPNTHECGDVCGCLKGDEASKPPFQARHTRGESLSLLRSGKNSLQIRLFGTNARSICRCDQIFSRVFRVFRRFRRLPIRPRLGKNWAKKIREALLAWRCDSARKSR